MSSWGAYCTADDCDWKSERDSETAANHDARIHFGETGHVVAVHHDGYHHAVDDEWDALEWM